MSALARLPEGVSALPAYAEPLDFRDLQPGMLVVVRYGNRGHQLALVKATVRNSSGFAVSRWFKAWKFSATRMRWTKTVVRITEHELVGRYAPEKGDRVVQRVVACMHGDAARFWEAHGKTVRP